MFISVKTRYLRAVCPRYEIALDAIKYRFSRCVHIQRSFYILDHITSVRCFSVNFKISLELLVKDVFRYNYIFSVSCILICPAYVRLSSLVSKRCLETFLCHVECAFCRPKSHVAKQRFATRWEGRTMVRSYKTILTALAVSRFHYIKRRKTVLQRLS